MEPSDLNNHVLPPGTNDSWRTWLMTGIRRPPVDRRRVRGAHKGLKKMLAEGMAMSSQRPYSWKEFSDAMVRQSVGDAVRQLPHRDAQVVKLAYFGGMSNHDIADQLGLSVASVERRLREAIARISRHVEQGRAIGRRATGAVVLWLSGRWLGDVTHHLAQAGAVATVAVIIATQPAPAGPHQGPAGRPAHVSATHRSSGPGVVAQQSSPGAKPAQGLAGAAAGPTSLTPLNLPGLPPATLPPVLKKVPVVGTRAQVPLRA